MFKSLRIIAILLAVGLMSACSTAAPDPGYEAVLVQKPMLFGHGGVVSTPVTTGRQIIAMTTEAVMVPMVPQTVHVAFDDYSSHDNILLDFDTAVQYRVTSSVDLISKFGSGWFEHNIESQYAAIVREAVKGHTMPEMMSDPAVATALDTELTKSVRELVASNHIPVEIINVTLGRAKPNATVLAQMNLTAAEQQRIRTMEAAKNAEDARKASEESRAIADDAYRSKIGYTVAQYAAMQIANINAEACKDAKTCIIAPSGTSALIQ